MSTSKRKLWGYRFSIVGIQPHEVVGGYIITHLVSIERRPNWFWRCLGSKYKLIRVVGVGPNWYLRTTGERAPSWMISWIRGFMAVRVGLRDLDQNRLSDRSLRIKW